jgi:hypothetical protein
MSDFEKILNVFEELSSQDGFAIKKTIKEGAITCLEIVKDGFHHVFDVTDGSLLKSELYPNRTMSSRFKSMY